MKSAAFSEFPVGERVPGTDWVMCGVIGHGGMGVVLEVQKGRNLRAAMKVLRPAFARSADFEARFAEEVEVMAHLRHPNIVEVWDCGVLSNGSPFLLMELLTGRTIRAVARDKDMRFTAEAVWKIVGQICAGLGYAHRADPPVVHRDVKPDNVFLHGRRHFDARVKLLDFGVAQVLGTAQSPDEVVGTPRYIAPEVLRKEPLSAKVDLYALAVLVYELLTQGFPWPVKTRSADAMSEAHLKLEPLAPSRWKSWIPKSVDDCLLRALSKDPAQRQRSVAEFYEELAELEVVDDGLAKYRTDAPTVPTVETLARGGAASAASRLDGGPANQAPQGAAGGWLDAARSRLADPVVSFEPSLVTATQSRQYPQFLPTAAEDADARPPGGLEVRQGVSIAAEPAASVDTPMTGASAGRMETRARTVPSAALLMGAAAVVVAAALGGWRALHGSPAARGTAAPVVEPSSVALAHPSLADRSETPLASPPAEKAPAIPDEAPKATNGASSPREDAGARRSPLAPHPKPSGSPPPSSANLDDVLFASDDAPRQTGPSSSARRVGGSAPAAGVALPTQPSQTLDDLLLLSESPEPTSAAASGRGPGGGSAPALREEGKPRSVPRTQP